jgi:hypothetical protein
LRLPFAGLGNLDQDPVEFSAAQQRLAVRAVGRLVHLDGRAAVGAAAFEQPRGAHLRLCAAMPQHGPEFAEIFRIARTFEVLALLEVHAKILGGAAEAQRDGVIAGLADNLDQRAFGHGQIFHLIAIAHLALFFQLEREAFVDAVGDERADGFEILRAPRILDAHERAANALGEGVAIERRVVLPQRRDHGDALVEVRRSRASADDGRLVRVHAGALGDDGDIDDDNQDGHADVGVLDAEADEQVDDGATAAAVSATPAEVAPAAAAAAAKVTAAAGPGPGVPGRNQAKQDAGERGEDKLARGSYSLLKETGSLIAARNAERQRQNAGLA